MADIRENTVVCVYSGELFLSSQFRFWKNGDSRVKLGYVGEQEVMLIPEKRANVGRYLNTSLEEEQANVRVSWILVRSVVDRKQRIEPVLVMISTKNIKKGDELRWYYGPDYVENHNLQA